MDEQDALKLLQSIQDRAAKLARDLDLDRDALCKNSSDRLDPHSQKDGEALIAAARSAAEQLSAAARSSLQGNSNL